MHFIGSLKCSLAVSQQIILPRFSWQPLSRVGDSKFVLSDLDNGPLGLFADGIASVSKALFALPHGRVHAACCDKP